MTTVQVKTEIQKVLEQVPEDLLPDILDYLKQIQLQTHDQISLSNNLKKVISEDKELLERLTK